MWNLSDGCDIFVKLRERHIKQTLFKRTRWSDEENHKEKNYLGPRDTMEIMKYDAFFVTTRCVLKEFLDHALRINEFCLFVYLLLFVSLSWDENDRLVGLSARSLNGNSQRRAGSDIETNYAQLFYETAYTFDGSWPPFVSLIPFELWEANWHESGTPGCVSPNIWILKIDFFRRMWSTNLQAALAHYIQVDSLECLSTFKLFRYASTVYCHGFNLLVTTRVSA